MAPSAVFIQTGFLCTVQLYLLFYWADSILSHQIVMCYFYSFYFCIQISIQTLQGLGLCMWTWYPLMRQPSLRHGSWIVHSNLMDQWLLCWSSWTSLPPSGLYTHDQMSWSYSFVTISNGETIAMIHPLANFFYMPSCPHHLKPTGEYL